MEWERQNTSLLFPFFEIGKTYVKQEQGKLLQSLVKVKHLKREGHNAKVEKFITKLGMAWE